MKIEVKPLEDKCLWGCVNSKGIVHHNTLSPTRKNSIIKLLDIFKSKYFQWDNFKLMGWKCVKLNISFTEISKE